MSTYAVGDLQACFHSFEALLARIDFDPGRDRLWLAGDLVGRGAGPLPLLRRLVALGDAVTAVLGNHDLRLLGLADGVVGRNSDPTLTAVIDAPDADVLLHWLRTRPLLYREGDRVLLHGGVLPDWTLAEAEAQAARISDVLTTPGEARRSLLRRSRGSMRVPMRWADTDGEDRLALAMNAMTAMRAVRPDGAPDFTHSGGPGGLEEGYRAWFDASPLVGEVTFVCGHWSALGLVRRPGLLALDTGCVHGRELTAVRLEDGVVTQVRRDARDVA